MKIIAHRGCSKLYGDNNMESYRQALRKGCYAIEMDVCITRDSVLIMEHNNVDKYGGGSVHDRDLAPDDLKLETVFLEFWNHAIRFILDIKDSRVDSNICEKILELCVTYNVLDRCILASFNENHLRDICCIENQTGLLIQKALATSNLHEDLFTRSIERFGLNHIIVCKFQVNPRVVSNCHEMGVFVYVYTCNTEGLYDYAKSIGCDGIITDNIW